MPFKDVSFPIKMSHWIQKQDLEVRVNWRGHHQSWVQDFQLAVLSSCDVLVILASGVLLSKLCFRLPF